jgi:hypothetical protein
MRVSWRTFLAIFAALLFVLPLVLLLGIMLQPSLPKEGLGGRRISPVLTTEARAQLHTYRRDCGLSSECEPPLGCLMETRMGRQYCTDSQCTTNAQCPEGQVCQNLDTSGDGPLVRLCVPTGPRQEGEACIALPSEREYACSPGLVCGGRFGWCARPCQPSEPAGCPAGFFCSDTVPQPLCLPTCEERGCPDGQFCARFDEGTSICAEIYGPNCQQTPCPGGRECDVGLDPARPGKVWMECIERCGEAHPPCPEGLACDGWVCRVPCNPADPVPCSVEGYVCHQHRPDRDWVCRPDW